MAEAQKITVRPRAILGKKVGRLRRSGVLPGVVGGGHRPSAPIETDGHAFELGYRRWGGTTLLSLEGLPEGEVSALIHGVSRHPVSGRLLHVDFQRVSLTEKTHADVPFRFVGDSPAVKTHGAVLLHAMDRIAVEALPQDIPHRIEVDLAPLAEFDDAIYVRDLVADVSKVRFLAEPDELVVKAMQPRAEEVVAPPTAAPAAVPTEGEEKAEAPAAAAADAKAEAKAEPKKD